jgi:hypothetical protein
VNIHKKPDNEQRVRDGLNGLIEKAMVVTRKEECYLCTTIKDAIAQGWPILDARNGACPICAKLAKSELRRRSIRRRRSIKDFFQKIRLPHYKDHIA